uniref:store-operated calcium entry-associated regulatory factor isoform X2 n=1 Tax=Nyctereutes procyonoides TaxID=34880 RepID=UPI00244456AA|nr:store-operated calcium entry-associated regulatory factor isoform X2 [Nyctereutes procyonoides]
MAAGGGPEAAGRRALLRLLWLLLLAGPALGWNDPDRILLRDIKALTLHHDRYTTSRRLDPIPQLKCVGGTAGCDSYTPKVIQCQNKGWDGYDVQKWGTSLAQLVEHVVLDFGIVRFRPHAWECKTDLDIAYKFGKTMVSCEGYEFSEDQYVLRGSCGLEYNLDYTELGLKKLRESGKNHGFNSFSNYYDKLYSPDSSGIHGLITILVLLAIAYGVYKLFLSDGQDSPPPYSEYPPNSYHYQRFTNSAGPPPSGFKSEYTGPHGATSGFGSAFTGQQRFDNSGPGFWTGLGTGGILGYLFGSNSTWNSRAYSPLRGTSGSYSASSSSETRTRTASGYGGTRRR